MRRALYLIPTVIAPDTARTVICEEVRAVVSRLSYFLVENERTARRYISELGLGLPIEKLSFRVLDKHTSVEMIEGYLHTHRSDIGVISEAGCPGIADPGALVVATAHRHRMRVVPLSGPSSIFMALMGSGFNGQCFVFHGYVPIERKERERKIKGMEAAAHRLGQTQLFMDTPYRSQTLFEHLKQTCRPDTQLCVARSITGAQEMVKTTSIAQWREINVQLHKTPTLFLIGTTG